MCMSVSVSLCVLCVGVYGVYACVIMGSVTGRELMSE